MRRLAVTLATLLVFAGPTVEVAAQEDVDEGAELPAEVGDEADDQGAEADLPADVDEDAEAHDEAAALEEEAAAGDEVELGEEQPADEEAPLADEAPAEETIEE